MSMDPVLYWLEDGKFARAMLVGPDQLVVDLTTGDGPSVIGKEGWWEAGYVAAYGGLVPESATRGTEPGQWDFGVAKLPEFADAALRAELARLGRRVAELEAFKSYVHQRLDEAGIPANPQPPKHALAGCRIGDRLDVVIGSAEALRGALAGLAENVDAALWGESPEPPLTVAEIRALVRPWMEAARAQLAAAGAKEEA